MLDKEPLAAAGILDLIAALAAQGASGRLDLGAGTTEGVVFFKDGKLIDARIGHLTGFQAINAAAAMPEFYYQFDPAASVPKSSSVTPSERLVLKQFFGIETVEPNYVSAPLMNEKFEEATVVPSPLAFAPTETVAHSAIETPAEATQAVTLPVTETVAPYRARSAAPYMIAFAVSLLVVALAAAAVLLRSRYRERAVPASVATSTEPSESSPRPAPAEPTTEPTEPSATQQSPSTATDSRVAAAPDLTGKWNVVNTVHTTAHQGFQNLQIGFALSISQTGRTFTARGQKVSENGHSLPAGSRTPIQLKGVIDGDIVEATFSEQGTLRRTNGRFVWKLDRAGRGLKGSFASTAGQSSGRSTARREL